MLPRIRFPRQRKGSNVKRSSLVTSAAVLSAAGLSAAAGALLRRLLRHGPVERALRVSTGDGDTGRLPVVAGAGSTPPSALPGWRESLPVTPVPQDTVTATVPEPAAAAGDAAPDTSDSDDSTDSAEGPGRDEGHATDTGTGVETGDSKPARTWVVENSSDWDGNPLELMVSPARARLWKGEPGTALP